jgi:phenylacetate-CoA ligase
MSFWKRWIYKQKLKQGNVLNYFEQLQKWQWLDQKALKELQEKRLSNLLLHAYRHVPYYREILKESGVITSKEQVNLSAFEKIPFLTKDIIRKEFEQIKSDDLNNREWYLNTSGGSTGEPVQFIQDKDYKEWGHAIKLLDDQWSNREIGDKQIRLWGSERDLFVGQETTKVRIGRYIRNERWLNAFRMTSEQIKVYVEVINKFKPIQILAYVESIFELAKFIEQNKLNVHHPKSIMTSAGTLYPYMRETIERVFQTKVFNRYGSREVGDIACECEHHQGLHVSTLTHYVEIIKEDGTLAQPGEIGEIVVTSLINYAMPLIRYRIGDTGVWAKNQCNCGRNWPVLETISGRVTDHFVKKDGTVVHGEYFTHLLYHKEWVKKFQFVQKDYELIILKIVLRDATENPKMYLAEDLNSIIKDIQVVMGKDCVVEFEFLDDIPPTASGKYRYTISEVR